MTITQQALERLRPALFLARNGLTMTGAALTTGAGFSLVFFWLADFFGSGRGHAYGGMVFVIVLPALFVLGLVLMPLGIWRRWRALRARGELPTQYPRVDLGDPLLQRAVTTFGLLTVVNVGMVGMASYHGLEYMDSVSFCGTACHAVMAPEYAAYVNSPHSRVACVECHIGPGASWFVKAKLDGTRQVFAMMLKTYSRPIPSPVQHLRPARETCEHCHWPQKFHGDKFLVRRKFAEDEKNSESVTVLVLKIGGRDSRGLQGIHGRHLDLGSRITYVSTDPKRQVIPWVSYVDDSGKTVEYASADFKPTAEALAKGERRQMDCIDCHNRPTHAYQLPERAVDEAMAAGAISTQLPWVKKKAIELLKVEYPDQDTAGQKIWAGLTAFYREQHPQAYQEHRALVEAAGQRLVEIYQRNVFPNMKLAWGTHPNNIGHEDFLGCFRCHDDGHKAEDGRVVSQDCGACHTILAMDESDPKILADLGLK